MIRKEILTDFKASHLDETPRPVLTPKQTGYMWTMSNRKGTCFRFEPTRCWKVAKELLADYAGAIVADGFSDYSRFKKDGSVQAGHCWLHVRREFYDIRKNYPQEAKEIITLIDELLDVEYLPKTWKELAQLR